MRNVRNDPRGRVIVGVDKQEGSVVALQCAAEEALRRDAVLVAVTVWSPYGGEVAERAFPCPELDASQQATAQRVLDAVCRSAGLPDGLAVERRVEKGLLGPVLAGLAHGPQDLLVIGLRHRPAFAWLRPSPDTYCLREAAAPVLIVPPDWVSTTGQPAMAA